MTLKDKSRLSFYKEIAEISTHKNVVLVQHVETRKIFVRKVLRVYDRDIYRELKEQAHPFFPRIYECVETGDSLVLVEEYIQGQSLEERLETEGVFSEEEMRPLMSDICEALRVLHERPVPVIHRDVKPSNILLTKDHQIKIVDFNIARHYEDGQERDTVVMGTTKYAAPEQYGYAQTDVRTDIYALGVMMNYLLTGKYPSEELYSGGLTPVIQKCMQFDPDKRYQSAAELEADILQDGADFCKEDADCRGMNEGFWKQNENSGKPDAGFKEEGQSSGEQSSVRKNHPFLPPGFRTGTWWKMLLALIGYALLWAVGLSLEVNDAAGNPGTGLLLFANRAAVIGIGMIWIFFWFDYMGIHSRLPLMRKKKQKVVGYIVYTFLIAFVIMMILIIFENSL